MLRNFRQRNQPSVPITPGYGARIAILLTRVRMPSSSFLSPEISLELNSADYVFGWTTTWGKGSSSGVRVPLRCAAAPAKTTRTMPTPCTNEGTW